MHLPFFLLVMLLIFPVSSIFSFTFSPVFFSLKVQCSELSTMHHPTSPAVLKMECFAPIFHGNHIFNLPDFNSVRRLMYFHYVTQDNAGIPTCHTAPRHLFFSSLFIESIYLPYTCLLRESYVFSVLNLLFQEYFE